MPLRVGASHLYDMTLSVVLLVPLLSAASVADHGRLGRRVPDVPHDTADDSSDADVSRVQALERALADCERRREGCETTERLTAEQHHAETLEQRAAILEQLGAIRQELALERVRRDEAARARHRLVQDLDAVALELLRVERVLAAGSADTASSVLERAAQVLAGAHSRDGAAWIAAAQEALARNDYYAARQAITFAIAATARAHAGP
jgi:hypothetical protein